MSQSGRLTATRDIEFETDGYDHTPELHAKYHDLDLTCATDSLASMIYAALQPLVGGPPPFSDDAEDTETDLFGACTEAAMIAIAAGWADVNAICASENLDLLPVGAPI